MIAMATIRQSANNIHRERGASVSWIALLEQALADTLGHPVGLGSQPLPLIYAQPIPYFTVMAVDWTLYLATTAPNSLELLELAPRASLVAIPRRTLAHTALHTVWQALAERYLGNHATAIPSRTRWHVAELPLTGETGHL